jgi:hypothetical protein
MAIIAAAMKVFLFLGVGVLSLVWGKVGERMYYRKGMIGTVSTPKN